MFLKLLSDCINLFEFEWDNFPLKLNIQCFFYYVIVGHCSNFNRTRNGNFMILHNILVLYSLDDSLVYKSNFIISQSQLGAILRFNGMYGSSHLPYLFTNFCLFIIHRTHIYIYDTRELTQRQFCDDARKNNHDNRSRVVEFLCVFFWLRTLRRYNNKGNGRFVNKINYRI